MKARFSLILAALLLILSVQGCANPPAIVVGSGILASEQRTFSGITGVALANEGDLEVKLGPETVLLIQAEDNLLPYITAQIEDGVLTIGSRRNSVLKPTSRIHYTLTVPALESLAVLSLGSITAPALEAERFSANINSTGRIDIASLQAKSLEVSIVSLGDVAIDGGVVDSQQVTIASTGSYSAADLLSRRADVTIASSGSVTLWTVEALDVNIKSSGDVSYYGTPMLSLEASGSGKVTPLGDK